MLFYTRSIVFIGVVTSIDAVFRADALSSRSAALALRTHGPTGFSHTRSNRMSRFPMMAISAGKGTCADS